MPLPLKPEKWDSLTENHFLAAQLDFDHNEQYGKAIEQEQLLHTNQRDAYYTILSSVQAQSGQVFFLHGPGGIGKTFVYKTLCHHLHGEGHIILYVASSGIASLLLLGG
jgi:chromosomal replication initiation ATPase DnaA